MSRPRASSHRVTAVMLAVAASVEAPTNLLAAGGDGRADTAAPGLFDGLRALGLTFGAAVVAVLVTLGVAGAALGGWAWWQAGRRSPVASGSSKVES